MIDPRETYSQMTDEQLLNLALQKESLTPFARSAFEVELAGRHLGPLQMAEYQEEIRRFRIEQEQRKPLAQTFHGFGTKIYGKRGFNRDGSFVTTKWVVLFWIPLIPLKSLRVKLFRSGGSTIFPGWSRKYLVLQVSPLDVRQVLSIYSFVGSLFLTSWALKVVKAGALVSWFTIAVLGCVPWLLRNRARQMAYETAAGSQPASNL